MKSRIWELDTFRGFCILGVVIVHFIFDLTELYGILHWDAPALFQFVQNWGGVLFLLLSGVCATLGSRSLRRGLIVFGCGMICTAVTAGMYLLGMADQAIIIRFGVLHCLGICMILWAVLKQLPTWVLGVLGAVMVAVGFHFLGIRVAATWLFPLGLIHQEFTSSDYSRCCPIWAFSCWAASWAEPSTETSKPCSPRSILRPRPFVFLVSAAANPCSSTCCTSPFSPWFVWCFPCFDRFKKVF